MGRPYSNDLRERVVTAVIEDGMSCRQAAEQFGVVPSAAIDWLKSFKKTGSIAAGKMGGHKPKALSGEHPPIAYRAVPGERFYLAGSCERIT